MKIRRIKIRNYGPVENIDISPARGLQVIYGQNEAGKTLTVDAIIILLSGTKIREIDRVGNSPDGEIVIDKNGKIISISRRTRQPTDYLNIDDPYDLRNIFIIRDSDLRIDNEAGLMRRLVGIEGERIGKIRESLLRLGRLSEKRLDLSDRYDHIKQRYDAAHGLIKEINDYLKEATKHKLEAIEIKSARLDDDIKKIDNRIHLLEVAKKAEDYERLRKALSDFRMAHSKSQELSIFSPGQLDMLTRYQSTINKKEEDLEMKNSDIIKKERHQKELLEKKETLVVELPEKGVEERVVKIREGFEKLPIPLPDKLIKRLPYIFIPLLGIFALFYYFLGLQLLTIAFGVGGIVLTGFFLYGIIRSAVIEMRRKKLIKKAKEIGIFLKEKKNEERDNNVEGKSDDEPLGDEAKEESEDKVDPIPSLHEFSEEIRMNISLLNRIEAELKILIDELKDDRLSVHRLNKEIGATKERLDAEFRKLGIDKLDDFYLKMEDLKKTEKKLAESRRSLVDYFKSNDPDLWQKGIEELRHDQIEIKGSYDPRKLGQLKDSRRKKVTEEEGLRALLDDHRGRLKEFERRISKLAFFNNSDPDFSVETTDGLKRILSVLDEFIAGVDNNVKAARTAIGILDTLSKEDETKLTDILSKRFNASKIFSEITGGRYNKIIYNPERKDYLIIQNDGQEKDLRQLSKGTFDQLYLSIRVALAEAMTEGPRFMVMDDPFLTSDRERLITQFDVLTKLIERGWQVIYFTVKDEIVEISRNYTTGPVIELTTRS